MGATFEGIETRCNCVDEDVSDLPDTLGGFSRKAAPCDGHFGDLSTEAKSVCVDHLWRQSHAMDSPKVFTSLGGFRTEAMGICICRDFVNASEHRPFGETPAC